MANVFIILRDEKKSPDICNKRQIPMSVQILKEIKGKCDKELLVSNGSRWTCIRVTFPLKSFKANYDCTKIPLSKLKIFFMEITHKMEIQNFH